ncbi:hypothetical protein DPMN_003935 [Dreissena polymorpha]|nr:hypothetical protein DPMN_003935 [Dreissena polymorpha]
MSANGEASTSSGGAGSGGSVLIELYKFEGYGDISCHGGQGHDNNGGGAAGRVAVHCLTQIVYDGTFTVYGGSGRNDAQSAGGGTVYLQDIRKSKVYKRLLLDNKNRPHDKYATIDEPFDKHYFDEVHLLNQASLHLANDNRNTVLDIYTMIGDGTGLLHMHANQKLFAEFRPNVRNAFLSGVNFIVDYKSEIIFPSITYIYGKGVLLTGMSESRSVVINGRLTGIADLIMGFETLLYFDEHAHTAGVDVAASSSGSVTYADIDAERTITFGTIDLRSYSEIKYVPDQTVLLQVARIDSRFKSVISAESIKVVDWHIPAGGWSYDHILGHLPAP